HSQQHSADLFVGGLAAKIQADGYCFRLETISQQSSARLYDRGSEGLSPGQGLGQDRMCFEPGQLSCFGVDLSRGRCHGQSIDVLGSAAFESGCESSVRPSGGCRDLLRSSAQLPRSLFTGGSFSNILRAGCSFHHRKGTSSDSVDNGLDQLSPLADV